MNRLDTLIPNYALNKQELDSYKKLCDRENAEIKQIMQSLVLSKYEAGGYRVTRTISERSKIDEELLLSIINGSPDILDIANDVGIIKTKQYIDFDAMENAIYKGLFSKDQLLELDRATETKEVVSLRVSKIKDKGEK